MLIKCCFFPVAFLIINVKKKILNSVRTTIVKYDWQLAYSLDWRYDSVLGSLAWIRAGREAITQTEPT